MTGYSFNRVRTAALKSIAAMQARLENMAADFGDVDIFLVGEAEQCCARLQEFGDSADTSRLSDRRRPRLAGLHAQEAPHPQDIQRSPACARSAGRSFLTAVAI